MSTDNLELIEEAFIFGFPLVFNLDQVKRYVYEGVGANPAAPFNAFSHARTLAGPEDTFVSINNDTLYSMAQIDLSVGPVLLKTPDTAGRYYVLQFVDAWTNNFAYVGHRATGTSEQSFLLIPPGWDGTVLDGAHAIHAPTTVFSIVGRWACSGDEDLPAVHRLQDATSLTPLSPDTDPVGIPEIDERVPDELQFVEKLRLWSQAFPPGPSDRARLASLAPLGLTARGSSPLADFTPTRAAEWGDRLRSAQESLIAVLRAGAVPIVNGWQLPFHAFDYNTDYFEVGTIDAPLYTSLPAEQKHLLRAGAALGGLWGNHAYEAVYAPTYLDSDGEQLHGDREYTLTLNPTPPAGAFWSLTMYSVPDFYLVANPADRYSIGSHTPGLVFGEDGSLTIHLGSEEPADPASRANWLPAPAGAFRPMLRIYEPDQSVVDGTYVIPAIQRVKQA